jgi:hypothetical protein
MNVNDATYVAPSDVEIDQAAFAAALEFFKKVDNMPFTQTELRFFKAGFGAGTAWSAKRVLEEMDK